MTSNQIKAILNELGYDINKVIPLEGVSSIYLTTDGCLYPDDHTLYEFKVGTNINLIMVYDAYKNENGELVKSKELPTAILSGDIVAGFTMVSKKHIKAPYTIGQAV